MPTKTAVPERRQPRRVAEVTLPPPYDLFTVSLWINLPQPLWRDLMGSDFERCAAAFAEMVTAHDLVDHDGAPYPPGGSPDLYKALPAELVVLINNARVGQIGKLSPPNAGS